MGCYLGTCGLTRLPIYHMQPVVIHFLIESETKDYAFSPNDRWDSFGLPIRGLYNDYGFIELKMLDKKYLRRHKLNAKAIAYDLDPHEGERYNICKPVNSETIMDLDAFHTMIHRGNLHIKRYYKKERGPLKVKYCMFHESAYDSMVSGLPATELISVEKMESFLNFILKTRKDERKNFLTTELKGLDWQTAEYGSSDYKYDNPRDFYIPRIFSSSERSVTYRRWITGIEQGDFTKKDIPTIALGLVEGLNFDRVLLNCRRLYEPISCTSQESLTPSEYDFGKVYLETLKMLDALEHEDEEDEDTE